jgi:predicted negative regulator of RcsB-dependent stress response
MSMEINATEEQQLEAIKGWWKENASSIITGLLLGLALLFGAKSWFAYKDRKAESASNIYVSLMSTLAHGDETLIDDRAGMLIGDYSSTPYAVLAAMALAKQKLGQNELKVAHAQLQWALDRADSGAMKQLVRLRLARVMAAEGNLDGADALLAKLPPDSAFTPLYDEVKGDIFAARGANDKARAEYEVALAAMSPDSTEHRLLQLKYENTAPKDVPEGTK